MIDFLGVEKDKKIVVALSGGVDSSTTIALLQEQGYKNITAITLILHSQDEETGIYSKDQNIIQDCQQVATDLGIKHHFIDLQEDFKKYIILPFLEGYLQGFTMNPCIICNRQIKFGVLLEEAQKIGCDIFVTGHYVKWDFGPDNLGAIYKSKTEIRDQSYFLSQVKKEALKNIRFPLANMTKDQVRAEAKRLGVHVSDKKSSSDLCFTGKNTHAEIIKKLYTPKSGNIVSLDGVVVGQHDGIHNFTIGQRKGIKIGGFAEACYVIKINNVTNEVIIGSKEALSVNKIILNEVNWLGELEINIEKMEVWAKVRAAQSLSKATLTIFANQEAEIIFHDYISGVAKGQICAFYDENGRLLGGGYIQ